MTRYDSRSIALAVALSALAGYVDATGFLSTGGFFVSFMSGNTTRLGIGLGQGRLSAAATAGGLIALFVAGVVVGTLVAGGEGRHRSSVLLLVTGLLGAAATAGSTGAASLRVACLALAMGAENATFQRDGEVGIGLTYMTGTLVKLGQRLASMLRGGPRWEWTRFSVLWLGMSSGAAIGAFAHEHRPNAALWVATAFAAALAACSLRIPLDAERG